MRLVGSQVESLPYRLICRMISPHTLPHIGPSDRESSHLHESLITTSADAAENPISPSAHSYLIKLHRPTR